MKPYRLSLYSTSRFRTASTNANSSDPKFVNKAQSGESNFQKDFERSHIQTSFFQKVLLGLGSGVVSITSPMRGDMIAVMGEVTGYQALDYMRSKMTASEEGRKILEEKPRITSLSVDLEKLKTYPEGTLGKAYSNFLGKYGYTPDTRNAVQFVDDIELAYIAQRYRESHDLIHTLLDMPTNMLGEVTVKWVEAIQFKLPMCATGALFGAVRLAPKFSRTYSTKSVIKISSSLTEKIHSNEVLPKHHPGVMHLPRVVLPQHILTAIKEILRPMRKELQSEAKAFNKMLELRVLPVEKDDERRMYKEFFQYFKNKLSPETEWNIHVEDTIEQKVRRKLNTIKYQWKQFKYDKRLGMTYLMARAPVEYAILNRVLKEIYKRDSEFAPKSLLDFGSGVGTVSWVAHEIWGSTLEEYYCIDASSDMHELAAMILRKNDPDSEPYIKNVYFRNFFPATVRLFDIVVSSFSLFEFSSCEKRLRMLTALWNDTKEYLVLIENGSNWGFKVITEARDFLLHVSKEQGVDCHIFAPCPHDLVCPRLLEEKKSPCSFQIKYREFTYTQSDDTGHANFCFVIFRKRPGPPKDGRPCRIVRNVLRRHRHVVCKLCTTEGTLIDYFATASVSGKLAYRCIKASKWGDLLPGPLEPKRIEETQRQLIADSDAGEIISDSDTESDSNSDDDDDGDGVTDDHKINKK